MEITLSQFKAKCLEIMDKIQKTHEEVVITKRGKPVAKLIPIGEQASKSPMGFLKGTVVIKGDIVEPLGEVWEADE
ncbi:MAG: type II toxin-antitoxin system prevent-host-death family antitoxin [Candidatus Latescibacteria bacterium]|nr:type II toxin-antitoxin system prevent-host-death family antitoxin [Candidatus Latescibacterota bacterium]